MSSVAYTAPSATALADRLEIIEVTARMGLLVDAQAWEELSALFTDPVTVDYTSLFGGDPQVTSPGELTGGWGEVLGRLVATQHLIAGQVVTVAGDEAKCSANVQATHLLPSRDGGPLWTVGGRYDFRLRRTGAGWQICGLTLTVQWVSGNRHILQPAASVS